MYNQKDLFLEILLLPFTDIEILNKIFIPSNHFFDNDEKYDKKRSEIEKDIITNVNSRQSIYSVDEVLLLIKNFYRQEHRRFFNKESLKNLYSSQNKEPEIILFEHLETITNDFLSHRSGRVCIKYWKSDVSSNKKSVLGPYEGLPKLSLWNSLVRYMSTDILVAIYLNRKNLPTSEKQDLFIDEKYANYIESERSNMDIFKHYYNYISLEDMQLEAVLKEGISETHLHASAAKGFYQTWESLIEEAKSKSPLDSINKWLDNRHIISNKKENFKQRILEAVIYRYVMLFSLDKKFNGDLKKAVEYLDEIFFYEKYRFNVEEVNDYGIQPISKSNRQVILELSEEIKDPFETILCKVKTIDERSLSYILIWLYDFMIRYRDLEENCYFRMLTEEKVKDILTLFYADGLQFIISNANDSIEDEKKRVSKLNSIGENIFLFQIIKNIKEKCQYERGHLIIVLLRYIAIKNMVYQEHVQRNQIKGLQNFLTYFNSSTKSGRQKERRYYWEQILKNQIQDTNLKKIEFRISMENEDMPIQEMQEAFLLDIKSALEAYQSISNECEDRELPLIGFIVHFIKNQDNEVNKCWMSYSEGGGSDTYLDHQKQRRLYAKQLIALKDILYKCDGLSDFIVGIDAASDENSAEPWVFAPIYDYARDSKDVLQAKNKTLMNHLGFTFHVGEDFRHFLTGIRRIDEVIEHFRYHSNDRIGHGISLGVDIKEWRRKHPVVIMPRIEYLENLIWMWGVYKNRKVINGVDGFLERRIMEIANDIYLSMEGITVYELWKSYQSKFKETIIPREFTYGKITIQCDKILSGETALDYTSRLFCCETDQRNAYVWNSEKLSLTYHCKVYRERMLEPISISSDEFDLETLQDLQSMVRKRISCDGIVVETNPTSNRAIGEIDEIFEHYIIDLKSKNFSNDISEDNVEKNLIVTINTDDPSVFQTTLSSEFAYIYYAMLDKGHAKRDVLGWIDEVRRNGMSSSFIKDRDFNSYQKEINDLLQKIDKEFLRNERGN